jgi:hypothetical protein
VIVVTEALEIALPVSPFTEFINMRGRPKMQRPMINTNDVAETQNTNVDLSSTKTTEQIYQNLQDANFAIVTDESLQDPKVNKYAKDLAFMEQQVVFTVARGAKEDPPVIVLGVNGQSVAVERGKPIRCARKFLNTLFTSIHEMATEQYTDKDGLTQTKSIKTQSPAYSVSLMEDTPDGRDWFAQQQRMFYI